MYGCQVGLTNLKLPDCPKEILICKPIIYSGKINNDTTRAFFDVNGFYYRIQPVQGLSTGSDEFGIHFDESAKSYLTQGHLQTSIFQLNRKAVNHFDIEQNMLPDVIHHSGFPTFMAGDVVLSVSPKGSEFGKSRLRTAISDGSNVELGHELKFKNFDPHDGWLSHPCLACNGQVLVFASSHDTSYGGTDIFLSIKINEDSYTAPINIGENINTHCDELTPFIDKENKHLYFASNGRENVGGYDIFKSKLDDDFCSKVMSNGANLRELFSKAENVGQPINTVHDEFSPAKYDNDTFYYASNQPLQTNRAMNFNIWVKFRAFKYEEDKLTQDLITSVPEVEADIKKELIIRGRIFDQTTNLLIDSVLLVVRRIAYEKSEISLFSDLHGHFELKLLTDTEYEITVQKPGYYFDTKRILLTDDGINTINLDFYLPQSGIIRINFPLDEYKNPYKHTLDSNGVETARTWQEELDLVTENILLAPDKIDKVILVGHTDDIGTDEYNMSLGLRRVEFIIGELVKRNVPRNILIGRSAGEIEMLERRRDEGIDTYRKRLRRVVIEKYYK